MEIRQYRIFIDFTGNDDTFNGIVEIDYYRNGEPLTIDAKDMKILSLSIDGRDFPYNHEETNSDYDPSPRRRARISNVEEGGKRKKRGRKYRNQRRGGPVDTPLELESSICSGVGSEFLS